MIRGVKLDSRSEGRNRDNTHLESLSDLLFRVRVVHLPSHEGHELCKVDRVGSIRVDLSVSSVQIRSDPVVQGVSRCNEPWLCSTNRKVPTSLIMSSSSAWVGF
jgi:hypothetical protein